MCRHARRGGEGDVPSGHREEGVGGARCHRSPPGRPQLGPDPITVSCVRSSRPPARELPVMAGSAVAWAGAPRGGSF